MHRALDTSSIQYSLLCLSLWSLLPLQKCWFPFVVDLWLLASSASSSVQETGREVKGNCLNRQEYPGVLRVSSFHWRYFKPSSLQMPISPKSWLRGADQSYIPAGKPRTAGRAHTHNNNSSTNIHSSHGLQGDVKGVPIPEKLHSTSQKGRQNNWGWLQQRLGRNTTGISNSPWLQLLGKSSSVYYFIDLHSIYPDKQSSIYRNVSLLCIYTQMPTHPRCVEPELYS